MNPAPRPPPLPPLRPGLAAVHLGLRLRAAPAVAMLRLALLGLALLGLALLGLALLGLVGPAAARTTAPDTPGQLSAEPWVGEWCLVEWLQDGVADHTYEGELVIWREGDRLLGTMRIAVIDGSAYGLQAMALAVDGDRLLAQGQIIEALGWVPDTLAFTRQGNRLLARGVDEVPQRIDAEFRYGRCELDVS